MPEIFGTDRQEPTFRLKYDSFRYNIGAQMPMLEDIHFFNFKLLESIAHDAPQGIIQYESVGEDGGATISTGRKIESLTLTGRLLNKYKTHFRNNKFYLEVEDSYSDVREELFELKDNAIPCELAGHPYLRFGRRKWIITNINTGLNSGENYLTFTISFKEYRQANVKKMTINLVNNKNVLEFKKNYALVLQSV